MAKKLATALVLGLMAALLVGAAPANAASNLSPQQAVAACKAERKADPAGFKVKYGLGSKKRGAFPHCVAAKGAPKTDQILGPLPSAAELPTLPGLPTTLPPSACQALNAALTQ